ncbi:uncharacterized protein [Hoplias malabaricus]|uniref:uncharacterized protein isoform X2 n=1 Tax=Hoplias malabaricus TaxID=27720 RepID=UPI0034619FBA
MVNPSLDHADNNDYRKVITDLQGRLKQAFPAMVNSSRIASCVQKDDETVSDYVARLTMVHTESCGLDKPVTLAIGTTDRSTWESYLVQSLLLGLKPQILAGVKTTCVGYSKQPLTIIEEHARHHKTLLREQENKRNKKKADVQEQAMLTMVQQFQAQTTRRGRGRGRGRDQKKKERDAPGGPDMERHNRCYNCDKR